MSRPFVPLAFGSASVGAYRAVLPLTFCGTILTFLFSTRGVVTL
ncbi:MAG TPA: hypothetical protein VHY83_15135 [Solirubrobacteraceae bacterium]|jgi:hypothetical protein|nr:hypothetical protein [Solirubrobacteraceae bacterium]